MTITQLTRSSGASSNINATNPTRSTRSNKENTATLTTASSPTHSSQQQQQLQLSGLKQPSTIPKRNYATTTSSSRRKQLNDALNVTADNITTVQQQPTKDKQLLDAANSALNRSQPIVTAAPAMSVTVTALGGSSLPVPLMGGLHLKRPSESSLPNPNNWTTSSTTLAAIPATPQQPPPPPAIAIRRNRLTFTDLTAASQSERDAARERIIADINNHNINFTTQLNTLYTDALEADAQTAIKHKIAAKQFDYKPKIAQLTHKCDLLRAALTAYQTKATECRQLASQCDEKYNSDLVVAHVRSFDLQQKCYGLERTVKGLQSDKSKLQGEKEAMVKELGETVEGKEKVEIMVREYEKVKSELTARVNELDAIKMQLDRDIERITQDRDDQHSLLLTAERERIKLLEKLAKTNETNTQLNTKIDDTHNELMAEKEETYRLEKLRVELVKSMDKQGEEVKGTDEWSVMVK